MAFRWIPLFGKRLFGKRRFALVVVSFPLITYVLFFLIGPQRKQLIFVEDSQSTILAPECPPCDHPDKQATAIATSTARIIPSAGKVASDLALSTGRLQVHEWSDICGTRVDNLRNYPLFPYFPSKSYSISDFYIIKLHDIRNSGERIFGFVHPHLSGEYKFVIVSDDTSELWLSPNEDPASSMMIARAYSPDASAWTVEGDSKEYPHQISKEIFLYADRKYFIETLVKSESRVTHVAVYWSYGHSSSSFEIISSQYLSSFSKSNNNEAIPPHAGKQPKYSLQSKSKLHYYFNRLPFVNRQEYIGVIPTCPYSPSFLVRRKLRQYEGVWLPKRSLVFPDDDTDMFKSIVNVNWSKPNPNVDRNAVQSVVNKLMISLRSRKYFLKKIHKVIHKPDPKHGDRFLLNLELGLDNTNQSFRLSEHVYQKKGNDTLCLPEGFIWNNRATVYFVLPVKDQGKWVHHFINQLTDASLFTGDTNFHVIIVDFESKDIDMGKAFNTSLLSSRHTIVSLTGKFFKTLALNKAAELVPNAHDIIFLFDLHIDVPPDIMDSVRMNTIAGRMAYFPIVGRLDCESSSVEHQGFWEMNGYGIMAIYKSDWDRFGGMNTDEFKYKWGGEDWDLLDRVLMLSMEVERVRHPGLYHHYHSKRNMWS